MIDKRVLYATAVYDQDEIDAVMRVFEGGLGHVRSPRTSARPGA